MKTKYIDLNKPKKDFVNGIVEVLGDYVYSGPFKLYPISATCDYCGQRLPVAQGVGFADLRWGVFCGPCSRTKTFTELWEGFLS
jgi:hypothetical protein